MSALANPRLSVEEYLRLEREAEIKSEYDNGRMYAMSGGSLAHSYIPANLTAELARHLAGKGCRVATSDLRVRVSPRGPFFYPDLTVICGQPQLADNFKDILLNPTVVFEVLSKSSEAYDRGHKFAQYRQVESLRDYVLISQSEPRVEIFARGAGGTWTLSEFVGLDAHCRIQSIGCEIPLADVYRDVSFEAE